MPDIKGWAVDRKDIVEVLESPARDIACVFYDYMEIGVGKAISRLAVYRGDKAKPELVYDSKRTVFWHLYGLTRQTYPDEPPAKEEAFDIKTALAATWLNFLWG